MLAGERRSKPANQIVSAPAMVCTALRWARGAGYMRRQQQIKRHSIQASMANFMWAVISLRLLM
jgi:hypothetical protein